MWPSLLQRALGDASFNVRNFGASGVPAQRYHEWGPLGEALALEPDAVIVMLGTNDAWCWSEPHFAGRYSSLLSAFQSLASAPVVVALVPPPLYYNGVSGVFFRPDVINERLPVIIPSIAAQIGCDSASIQEAFRAAGIDASSISCDGCHVGARGQQLISETVASALTRSTLLPAPSPLRPPPTPPVHWPPPTPPPTDPLPQPPPPSPPPPPSRPPPPPPPRMLISGLAPCPLPPPPPPRPPVPPLLPQPQGAERRGASLTPSPTDVPLPSLVALGLCLLLAAACAVRKQLRWSAAALAQGQGSNEPDVASAEDEDSEDRARFADGVTEVEDQEEQEEDDEDVDHDHDDRRNQGRGWLPAPRYSALHYDID